MLFSRRRASTVLFLRKLKFVRRLTLAIMATAVAAFSQVGGSCSIERIEFCNTVSLDNPFQIRHASNLGIGDSVVNITNSGARESNVSALGLASGTSASTTGAVC